MQVIKDILPSVLRELRSPEKTNRTRLLEHWPSIAGPRLAAHTRPRLTPKGELWVWVDQSALAFELSQRYRHSFLKRVQAVIGGETVKSIHFRVGQLRS